jgi:hypothetical protein
MKKTISRREKNSLGVCVLIIASILISGLVIVTPLVRIVNAGDITTDSDSNSTISIWVWTYEPRIEWYDFQWNNSGIWESVLNQQIDINETYRFIINITSDQGWGNVEHINFTAWFDNGSEATTYNNSGNLGGNKNLKIMYENTTGTGNNATFTMLWPDDEVTFVRGTETRIDSDRSNISVEFIPGKQFRYATDPSNTTAGHNDLWSWNFNITSDDEEGYESHNNPVTGEQIDEFGVYSYTEIVATTGPNLNGAPGENTSAVGVNVTIQTITNGNYSLSVNVSALEHQTASGVNMSNTTLWVRGGDLAVSTNFNGTDPIYLFGSNITYYGARSDGITVTTDDIEYVCSIPDAQLPGDYQATIYYILTTQIG